MVLLLGFLGGWCCYYWDGDFNLVGLDWIYFLFW